MAHDRTWPRIACAVTSIRLTGSSSAPLGGTESGIYANIIHLGDVKSVFSPNLTGHVLMSHLRRQKGGGLWVPEMVPFRFLFLLFCIGSWLFSLSLFFDGESVGGFGYVAGWEMGCGNFHRT